MKVRPDLNVYDWISTKCVKAENEVSKTCWNDILNFYEEITFLNTYEKGNIKRTNSISFLIDFLKSNKLTIKDLYSLNCINTLIKLLSDFQKDSPKTVQKPVQMSLF